jgi:hypothetical protein
MSDAATTTIKTTATSPTTLTTTPSASYDWEQPATPPLALAGIAYFAPLYEHAVLADRKAGFFISASGLMLTVLGFFMGRIVHLLSMSTWLAWAFGILLAVVVVLVVVAAITAYVSFSRLLPPIPPSLAVFRDIARRTREQYVADVSALSHRQAFVDMLTYNHVVATWGLGKFRTVQRALALLRVAIPLWMLVLLILALAG